MNRLTYPFDAAMLRKKQKSIRRELLGQKVTFLEKKIAILGGSTTNLFPVSYTHLTLPTTPYV